MTTAASGTAAGAAGGHPRRLTTARRLQLALLAALCLLVASKQRHMRTQLVASWQVQQDQEVQQQEAQQQEQRQQQAQAQKQEQQQRRAQEQEQEQQQRRAQAQEQEQEAQAQAQEQQEQERLGEAAGVPPGFRFNRVVAIIAFDRFKYFRQMVSALQQAWGSQHYTVTIWIDGPPQQEGRFDRRGWERIVALSRHLQWLSRNGSAAGAAPPPFRDVVVHVSRANLGVWANKKRGVAGAMALSDYAVVLEDDVVLAPDGLRWFEWHVASGLIFRRPDIAVATCWSVSFPASGGAMEARDVLSVRQLGLLDKYWVDAWAQPWGWALWRRTWDALGEGWSGRDFHLGQAVQAAGWRETMPLVARCNNIGSVGHNKKGMLSGHVHQRAITSALFPRLDACRYAELERANTSALIDNEELYRIAVRRGISADSKFASDTMEAQAAAGEAFMAEHPVASGWRSTC